MRVAFCGGTGGHVYPALTVASALRDEMQGRPLDLLYIGVRGKIDADLVAREGIPFEAVTAGPLRVGNATGTAKGGLRLGRGTAEAYRILRRFRPDVVFATGGYGSVGVGLATRLRRIPLLLFLPDVEAGMAVKLLARVARTIAVTNETAAALFAASKTVLTGYPVRASFFSARRDDARAKLGLHPELPALLVSGASSGANALNRAVASWSADFLRVGQLIHLCGPADYEWLSRERDALPPEARERYHLYDYLHEDMALALAASDVAVMRSGASSLGELPAARLPAILVPGEYEGWDQSPNAVYLEAEGAAVMLPQAEIDRLQSMVMQLLADDLRRGEMKKNLERLARPDAAKALARQLMSLAGVREGVAA